MNFSPFLQRFLRYLCYLCGYKLIKYMLNECNNEYKTSVKRERIEKEL